MEEVRGRVDVGADLVDGLQQRQGVARSGAGLAGLPVSPSLQGKGGVGDDPVGDRREQAREPVHGVGHRVRRPFALGAPLHPLADDPVEEVLVAAHGAVEAVQALGLRRRAESLPQLEDDVRHLRHLKIQGGEPRSALVLVVGPGENGGGRRRLGGAGVEGERELHGRQAAAGKPLHRPVHLGELHPGNGGRDDGQGRDEAEGELQLARDALPPGPPVLHRARCRATNAPFIPGLPSGRSAGRRGHPRPDGAPFGGSMLTLTCRRRRANHADILRQQHCHLDLEPVRDRPARSHSFNSPTSSS